MILFYRQREFVKISGLNVKSLNHPVKKRFLSHIRQRHLSIWKRQYFNFPMHPDISPYCDKCQNICVILIKLAFCCVSGMPSISTQLFLNDITQSLTNWNCCAELAFQCL